MRVGFSERVRTRIVLSSMYPLESGSLRACGLFKYLRRYSTMPANATPENSPTTAKHIPDMAPASNM